MNRPAFRERAAYNTLRSEQELHWAVQSRFRHTKRPALRRQFASGELIGTFLSGVSRGGRLLMPQGLRPFVMAKQEARCSLRLTPALPT